MASDNDPDSASSPGGPPNGWWKDFSDKIPDGYLDLTSAEEGASHIIHYHPVVIPGLLQTRRYAAAVTRGTTLKALTEDDVATLVDVRMTRQRAVLDSARRRRLTMMMDEACLHRPVGDDATMREQLTSLLTIAERPLLRIVVAPFRSPPHPGLLGPFMILRFENGLDDVLCFEGQTGNVVIRNRPGLTRRYDAVVNLLTAGDVDGTVAATLIRRALDRLGGPLG